MDSLPFTLSDLGKPTCYLVTSFNLSRTSSFSQDFLVLSLYVVSILNRLDGVTALLEWSCNNRMVVTTIVLFWYDKSWPFFSRLDIAYDSIAVGVTACKNQPFL